jgi:diaminopropionate ammonia-lyase
MNSIKWHSNSKSRIDRLKASVAFLQESEARRAHRFLQTSDAYDITPLTELRSWAAHLGVTGVYVKDESYRFGLNAFKVLGGTYSIGRYLAERLNTDIEELSFEMLKSEAVKERIGEITFITATDGNHGRGVAWAARQLGQKAVVYMPKGTSLSRYNSIKETGAEVYVTEWNYDECVRLCAGEAEKHGWVVIQDTAWDGYDRIPNWIMQGYSTIALEAMNQFENIGIDKPTHIFLQAGVGSFAGAILGFFASKFHEQRPITAIIEPNKADCLFRSAEAGDGQPRFVTGSMDTIMAGLACGEPNPVAWGILNDYADLFISCHDPVAAKGMRILGNPLEGDTAVVSGESGAVTAGLLGMIMQEEQLAQLRHTLQLDNQSRILLISTEGDTDPEHYRSVVWDGLHPSHPI